MKAAELPPNEEARLAELRDYEVLDTPLERAFDDLAKLAAAICGTPIALISLVDRDRQWFKARVGLDATETPRELAFCAHAILKPDNLFEIQDSSLDPRFADNPLVVGAPIVRFYAGAPLVTPAALAVGTLCVIDHTPRELRPDQREALTSLARHVVNLLELRRALRQREALSAELERSNEVAVSASRAKSEFLAHMSHEIRTPMNGVLGMARLLCETTLSDEQREMAESIVRAAEAQLTILNDVLDLSKVEAGRIELERVPFDLVACVEDAVEGLASSADERRLGYGVYVDPSVPARVVGDPSRVRQVLTNLISNALKFTERGAVAVRVAALSRSSDEIVVSFRVTDTGIGIESDVVTRLFQPFSQGDRSTARKYGGTGLGLVICKRLTELMGGAISVESERSRGSTFQFTARLGLDAGGREELTTAMFMDRRVLCVCDSDLERRGLLDQLRALGIAADGARDEASARAALVANLNSPYNPPYSAVFIALSEALGAGLALARSLHGAGCPSTLRLGAPLPVVLIARRDERQKLTSFAAAGLFEHLPRPLKSAQIADVMRRCFGISPPLSAAPEPTSPLSSSPLSSSPLSSSPLSSSPLSASPASFQSGERLKVLLAEDNVMGRIVSKRLLEKLGCDVDLAENGRIAVESCRRLRYDLVFMDCQMPEMDGYEATRAIRALPSDVGRIPIIAMTASAMEGDRDLCLEAGMDDYISKPVRSDLLADAVARHRPSQRGSAP